MPFASILEAARNGSGDALGEILHACRSYMAVIAVRHVPRKLQARIRPSSLVQETYVRALRGFGTFRGQSERQLLAWLRKILLRCLMNLLRRPEFQMPLCQLPGDVIGTTVLPEEEIDQGERGRALEQALARLPDHYRVVIELHHFDKLTFAEIGQILGRSAEAARKLWAQAQIKLGNDLQAFQ